MRNHSDHIRAFNHIFEAKSDELIVFGKKIIDGEIHVGDIYSADREYVRKHGFTEVLHCEDVLPGKYENVSEIFLKGFEDWERENIFKYLPKSFEFLDNAFKKNKNAKVLIHCFAGSSRSSAIACAFIMKARSTSYEDTVQAMKTDRMIVHPNSGFSQQLKLFEAFGYQVSEEVIKKSKILTNVEHKFSDEQFQLMIEIESLLKKKNGKD